MKEHLGRYTMAALCEGLQVSRSGFYAWQSRPQRSCGLNQRIAEHHRASSARTGAPALCAIVRSLGYRVSARTVGRRMQRLGLRARYSKKFVRTTDSKHRLPVAQNLLNRQFRVNRPNQVWVGDITYLRTTQVWLYLAVLIDLHSRLVVGWQMSERIDQALVIDALQAALLTRGNPKGVMIHTDRGSQYCADNFVALIDKNALIQSMSRRENAGIMQWLRASLRR